MTGSIEFAKWLMLRREVKPTFDRNNVGRLREVFNHPEFLGASVADQYEIMFKASDSSYRDEIAFPVDRYFGFSIKPSLTGKSVLDLGCGNGGRAVAWFERYEFSHVSGIEIDPIYVAAADRYATRRGISADFKVGFGESLPYPNDAFNAVLTFDVLEHVVDVAKTLSECWRVLKPGGQLFLVFPTYFQPLEHHLGLVTRVPGIQLLFSGKTLVRAYTEIINERGDDAKWYRRESGELRPHEAGNTINGLSFRRFRQLIKSEKWESEFVSHAPIGTIGRSIDTGSIAAKAAVLLSPLTYIPYLQEVFLHRVTMILRKR